MNDNKHRLATDATPDDHTTADEKDGFSLSTEEKHDVEEKQPPRAAVLHETIRLQGEEELGRSISALGWSALAAGLSMGFSMLARGLLTGATLDKR